MTSSSQPMIGVLWRRPFIFCVCWLTAVVMFVGAGVAQAEPFIGSGSGLLGAYCNRFFWNETDPCDGSADVTRIDATVDFRTGDGDWPASGIGDDTFSVRWTGQIQAQYTEDYTFHALHDDGVRVWVDGTLVIDDYVDQDDNWSDSGTPLSLQRGQKYDIVIEYYENSGDQDMVLGWSSASTSFRDMVPESQLYPPSAPSANLLAAYRFDESAWDGTSGQVTDASGNGRDGTAQGGADTAFAGPAISGDPGTCGYGTFDGSDDYVSVSNLSDTLNSTATLAFWVRTTQSGSSTGYESPGITGVEEAGGTGDIFWGWIDSSGRIGISVANDFAADQKSTSAINDGTWHHVALTRDASGGETRVYVDGTLESTGSTPTGTIDNAFESIGRIEDTGGSPEYFDGELDEVRIYDGVLDENEVQTVYNGTHACPATPARGSCSATFPSAVQNTANAGSIDLEFEAQVTDPDNLLETTTLNDNVGFGNTSCGGTDCTATTPLATVPNVPAFQTASGNNDVDTQGRARSFALGQDGETDYDQIQIRNNETLNDSGNFSTYRIDDLQLNFRSTWNLEGGTDYYVDDITLGTRTEINVTGSGTARLFVRGSVTFPFNSTVNSGGTPDRLIIVGYNDITVSTGNAQPVNALVYAQGDVSLEFQDQVNGAVAAAGNVTLGNSAQVTYDQGAVSGVDDRGFCPTVETFDGYAIDVGLGTASTCQPRTVTITAEDDAGDALTDYTGTVNLATSSGNATWSVADAEGTLTDATADDGAASYTFVESDNGTIELDLANQHADDLTITVTESDGAPSATSSNVSFRHNAFVIEPRSALANKANNDLVVGLDQPFQATLVRRDPPTPSGQCGIATNYDESSQDVKLWVERNADDPGGNAPQVNGDGLPSGAPGSTNVTLDFSGGTLSQEGRAPFALATSDVGKYALMIEDTTFAEDEVGNPRPITGGTRDYVVRPFGLRLTANGNPAAVNAAGSVYRVAATDFDVTVAGVVYDSADDDGGENGTADDGIPDGHTDADASAEADLNDNAITPSFGQEGTNETAEVTSALVAPSGGASPPLDGEPVTFTDFAGDATRPASWPEVGIIELAATVTNYLGSGRSLEGRSGEVGRFKPAEFSVTPENGELMPSCTASEPFAYIGQKIAIDSTAPANFEITALNAQGETTQNYTFPGFQYLSDDDLLGPGQVEYGGEPYSPSTDGVNRQLTSPDEASGVMNYKITGDVVYEKSAGSRPDPSKPEFAVDLSSFNDGDGVSSSFDDMSKPQAMAVAVPEFKVRYGRLRLGNTYGPETLPLVMPTTVEFWNGSEFVTNTEENGCWQYNPQQDPKLLDPVVAVNESTDKDFGLSEGEPNPGGRPNEPDDEDGRIWLKYDSDNNIEENNTQGVEFPVPRWLQDDFDGDGSLENPTATATFGVYRGHDRIIYWREVQ